MQFFGIVWAYECIWISSSLCVDAFKEERLLCGAGSWEKVWSVCPGHRGRTTKEAEQTTQKSQAQVSHSYWVSPVTCFALSHVCACLCACEHGLHVYAYKRDLCACVCACGHVFYVCVHAGEHAWCACVCVRMHACLWVHAFLQSLCACVCS